MHATAPPAPVVGFAPAELTSPALALQRIAPHSASTTLRVRHRRLNVLEGERVSLAGRLAARVAPSYLRLHPGLLQGRAVALQARRRGHWRTLATTNTGPGGRFTLRYIAHWLGSAPVRVRFAGDAELLATRRMAGRLNVYRAVGASWFGGGGALACGGSLTSATLGVANRTLPCGTLVTLRFGRRVVRVPVIDRGPYVSGREFDLTEATKEALGFGDTGQLWSTA
jgi:hypothetical protein